MTAGGERVRVNVFPGGFNWHLFVGQMFALISRR